jgi:hypothetical protein
MSAACVTLLVLSAKRGPLLLPFAYLAFGYSFMKGSVKPLIPATLAVITVAMMMNQQVSLEEDLYLRSLSSLSTSFFVGVRELTRLLTIFDGNLLWGRTYAAGLLSFIPTEWFAFKAEFNYMRYVALLGGADPNMYGGMRSSYIGEALINFGHFGIAVVSFLFAIVVSALDSWFMRSRWLSRNGIVGIVFGFAFFHMAIFGFYESGSSAILFFLNRIGILLILILSSLGVTRRMTTRADVSAPARSMIDK